MTAKKAEQVSTSGKHPNDKPTGQEVAKLVAGLKALGITGQELGQFVSATVSRRENARRFREWAKGLPKKKA